MLNSLMLLWVAVMTTMIPTMVMTMHAGGGRCCSVKLSSCETQEQLGNKHTHRTPTLQGPLRQTSFTMIVRRSYQDYGQPVLHATSRVM